MFLERPEVFFLPIMAMPIIIFLVLWELRAHRRIERELLISYDGIFRKLLIKTVWTLLIFLSLSALLAQINISGGTYVVKAGGEMELAFDNTESMDARMAYNFPSRGERSKNIAFDILENTHFVRVGVCTFGGFANCIVPTPQLTDDRKILTTVIEDFVLPDLSLGKGTNLVGSLKDMAQEIIEYYPNSDKLPLVVVFTDGEENNISDPSENSEDIAYLRESGILFIFVGVGEVEGARIPRFDKKGKTTGSYSLYMGEPYVSFLKEDYLRDLSQRIGGQYFFENERKELKDFIKSSLLYTFRSETVEERAWKNISRFFIIPLLVLFIVPYARRYII